MILFVSFGEKDVTVYTLPAFIIFEAPSILFGLFAILIPIIIHLFNLRKVKKIEFSNTALLRKVQEETSSKRKPIELLILASRILAIICLVLTFARPIYKSERNELSFQDEVLIYFDNSQSLSVKGDGDQTGFDKAYNLAQGIVNAYPEGTIFRFIENGYTNSVTTEFTEASLTDNLTELQQIGVGRSFDEVIQRKDGQNIEGDVYLVSDFQNTAGLEKLRADTLSQYFLVPVTGNDYSNISIDTAFLQNTFLSGNVTNLLKVRFKRNDKTTNSIGTKIYFEDQLSGTAQIDFKETLYAEHDFEIPLAEARLDKIRINIDDPGLAFDNDFYLTINQLDKVRVLEIYNGQSPTYLSSLFESNELFQFDRLSINALDNGVIAAADFIMINELNSLSNQLQTALKTAITNGKAVVVVPSNDGSVSSFTGLGLSVRNDTDEMIELDVPDYENPFFEGVFEENSPSLDMPSARTKYRLINEELSYLSFRNGRSFLSKVVSEGNLFFFASSFEATQTSFTNHAIFVPVMYKLALGSKVSLTNLYYYTDSETIFFPIDRPDNTKVYSLRKNEEVIIPDQRQEESRLIMEIPKDLIEVGQYELLLEEELIGLISFNLPKQESDVKEVDFDVLEDLSRANNISILNSASSSSIEKDLAASINGLPLWKYALLVGLLFLFVEIILIRYL
ncbi:BatA domain-containing protein [Roseivirga sp.]|uniref:BatA domain-containing protein n=1 Tax=Roseivirga sp. TaxID=1964215 RepID=UPI003B8CAA66